MVASPKFGPSPQPSTQSSTKPIAEVIYPDCDGNPMADNTKQFDLIVKIKLNLESLCKTDPNIFVAGDLLWYPVEGDNKTSQAPDVMVAIGRPKGYRGSYQQWKEGNIAPQVVFEILSPGNRRAEMERKFTFYEKYGVEEYYIYNPMRERLTIWVREGDRLEKVDFETRFTSPRLGIQFVLEPGQELEIYKPNGEPFKDYDLLEKEAEQEREERQKAQAQTQQAQAQAEQAEQERQQAENRAIAAESQVAMILARLRELGMNPDEL